MSISGRRASRGCCSQALPLHTHPCSWALDILSGRVVEATRADAIDRAYSNRSVSVSDDGGDGEASSPRIGAVGGSGRPDAAAGFSFAPPSPLEALSGPGGCRLGGLLGCLLCCGATQR